MMLCRTSRTLSERRGEVELVKREVECVVSWRPRIEDARRLSRTMTPGKEGLRSNVLRYSDSLTTTEMQVWRERGWLRRHGRAEFTDLVEFEAGLQLGERLSSWPSLMKLGASMLSLLTQAVCVLLRWHATTMTMVIMARKEPLALLRQDVAPTRGAYALDTGSMLLIRLHALIARRDWRRTIR
jgi:hypothetical protein